MTKYGLVVDYRYCTGCNTCEVACQMEKHLPVDQFGIKVIEVGPWQLSDDAWQLEYFPLLTKHCDLCEDRVAAGKQPSCVQHCMGDCLRHGSVEELTKIMGDKHEQLMLIPQQ